MGVRQNQCTLNLKAGVPESYLNPKPYSREASQPGGELGPAEGANRVAMPGHLQRVWGLGFGV